MRLELKRNLYRLLMHAAYIIRQNPNPATLTKEQEGFMFEVGDIIGAIYTTNGLGRDDGFIAYLLFVQNVAFAQNQN